MRLGAGQRFHRIANYGNARRATHHYDLVDLLHTHARVFDAISAWAECAIHNINDQFLKQLARDLPLVLSAFVLENNIGEGNK